jgi:hypothetical protein
MKENYAELFDIKAPGSDEVFMQKVMRKVNIKQQKNSVFKPLYALTAMILVIGVVGIGGGVLLNGGFFAAPEAGYDEGNGVLDIEEIQKPNITTEIEIIYADSQTFVAFINAKSDQPVFNRNDVEYARYHADFVSLNRQPGNSSAHSVEFVSEYEISMLVWRFLPENSLQEGGEYTLVLKNREYISEDTVSDIGETPITFVIEKFSDALITEPNITLENIGFARKVVLYNYGVMIYIDNAEMKEIFGNQPKTTVGEDYEQEFVLRMTDGTYIWRVVYTRYGSDDSALVHAQFKNPFGSGFMFDEFDIRDVEAIIYKGEEIPLKNSIISEEQAIELFIEWNREVFGDYYLNWRNSVYCEETGTFSEEPVQIPWEDGIYTADLIQSENPDNPPIYVIQYSYVGVAGGGSMFMNALTGEMSSLEDETSYRPTLAEILGSEPRG